MDLRSQSILLVGAWDQAATVLDIVLPNAAAYDKGGVVGIIDDSASGAATGRLVQGVPILDHLSRLDDQLEGIGGAVVFATGGLERENIASRLKRRGIPTLTVVHPLASISESAIIGAGCVIAAGVVVGAGARIGPCTILRPGVVVEPDATVGNYSRLEAHATVGAGARLGERSWVGLRAAIQEHVAIGPDSVIALGSVVTWDLEPGSVVAGVPARPSEPDPTHPEFDLV